MTGNGAARHRFDVDHVAVGEAAHVQFAGCDQGLWPVCNAVDDQPARSADAFAAVAVERDRILPCPGEPFIEDVEHLEKRHVRSQGGFG